MTDVHTEKSVTISTDNEKVRVTFGTHRVLLTDCVTNECIAISPELAVALASELEWGT